jgi:predicted DNA-binding protein YlxM (UPF0122 family)
MYIVLLKELDFSDEDIIELLKVSKGSIHNARKRLQPLLNSLEAPEW